MEITTSLVYWATRLDYIKTTAMILTSFSGPCTFIFGILLFANTGIEYMGSNSFLSNSFLKSVIKWSFSICILSVLTIIFTPNTKEMAAMVIIPKVANSEKIDSLGNGMYNLAIEWMEELRPNKMIEGDK